MATLYGSLRKQLPIEFLKGKRSISDHIHETVNYIRHMQDKIQALSDKRDELKGLSDPGAPRETPECSRTACSQDDTVMVQPCMVGVEILINTASQLGLPLSRAFKALAEEGVNVISCNSTQVNERLLHSIKAEVTNGGNSNLSELRKKLMKLTT
ncbi:uncharacterized protein J3R85_016005 [Psidium guajava]|nr:uncharacterized protein J3R85_016005 [Psidium guajava]